MSKKIVRTFKIEKETKNTIRFQEQEANGVQEGAEVGMAIGPLYIQKSALQYIGFDDNTVQITIESLN